MATIQVTITNDIMQKARDFAEKKEPTSYRRFGETKEQAIERLTVGKIGEQVGQEAFSSVGIPHSCPGKFDVEDKVTFGDAADCVMHPDTERTKRVDFKTAWKPFHVRILVPQDMFEGAHKRLGIAFYIGIKTDLENREATVHGYTTREEMMKHPVTDFGEGPAYWVYLDEMHDLDDLK